MFRKSSELSGREFASNNVEKEPKPSSWQDMLENLRKESTKKVLLPIALMVFGGISAEAQTKPSANAKSGIEYEVIIDPTWGDELWIRWKKSGAQLSNQTHIAPDGKSGFNFTGVGVSQKVNKNLTLTEMVGPVVSLKDGRVTHISAFANAIVSNGDLTATLINRFNIPLGESRFNSRHVQNVQGIRGMPKNTGLMAEELPGKELFVGAFYQTQLGGKKVRVSVYARLEDPKNRGVGMRLIYKW